MLKRTVISAFLILAACSKPWPEPGSVAPADASQRAAFGSAVTEKLKPETDAPVKELFCKNALASPCPADIDERLSSYYTNSSGTRLDMADAFTRMNAALTLGDPKALISDEAYLKAAYQVVLGREPDPSGWAGNLDFILRTGERKLLLRSMLQSPEFAS